jgi:hypothetical protein
VYADIIDRKILENAELNSQTRKPEDQTMTMSKRIQQLQALSTDEWRVLLLSMTLLPLIALALKLKGLKWTQALLSRYSNQKSSISEDDKLKMAQSVARMVSAAANHGPYRANCLKKALATWWLLGRRGIVTEIRIGVNKASQAFSAHAWVVCRGNVLADVSNTGDLYSTLMVVKH